MTEGKTMAVALLSLRSQSVARHPACTAVNLRTLPRPSSTMARSTVSVGSRRFVSRSSAYAVNTARTARAKTWRDVPS